MPFSEFVPLIEKSLTFICTKNDSTGPLIGLLISSVFQMMPISSKLKRKETNNISNYILHAHPRTDIKFHWDCTTIIAHQMPFV